MRTLLGVVMTVLVGCGGTPAEPPLVALTPALEAQLAVGAECTHLMRIGAERSQAPNVMQCKSPTAYVSVNHYEKGEIQSIELALGGTIPELRKLYAAALAKVAPPEVIAAIQARLPDAGAAIEAPEISTVAGIKLMISSARTAVGWRYDVTLSWR